MRINIEGCCLNLVIIFSAKKRWPFAEVGVNTNIGLKVSLQTVLYMSGTDAFRRVFCSKSVLLSITADSMV